MFAHLDLRWPSTTTAAAAVAAVFHIKRNAREQTNELKIDSAKYFITQMEWPKDLYAQPICGDFIILSKFNIVDLECVCVCVWHYGLCVKFHYAKSEPLQED